MPTRRTSPRRSITRPTVLAGRSAAVDGDFEDDDPRGGPSSVAPWLALLALVLAAAALGWTVLGRAGGGGDLTACRSAAWAAVPQRNALPTDWRLNSSDLNANGITISLAGPAAADGSTGEPVVYASVTCYGEGAPTAMREHRAAAKAAGATIVERSAAADAYDVDNPSTGSITTLIRVGGLVGQVAGDGTAAPADLDTITRAIAAAMGDPTAAGAPGTAPSRAPGPSDALVVPPSDEPIASAFAPELEAAIPKSVGDVPLTVQSASADTIFRDDPGSRALGAEIRSLGATLADLQLAEAYDESGTIDLSIIAFRLPKVEVAKLRAAILETWLSAKAAGVTVKTVTLGGKELTKVDYGDDGSPAYVYARADYVVVITTADEAVATEVAKALE